MPIFRWFKKTNEGKSHFPGKRLTIDEILAMDNSTEMLIELSYGLSDKINRSGFESLSHAEKVMNSVYWLESEINNGGFEQYYFNSSGNYAVDTPTSLENIGANRTAEIVREANDAFPGGLPPRNRDERIALLNQVTDDIQVRWNELDNQFLKYEDQLEKLQINYLKLNKKEFKLKD